MPMPRQDIDARSLGVVAPTYVRTRKGEWNGTRDESLAGRWWQTRGSRDRHDSLLWVAVNVMERVGN